MAKLEIRFPDGLVEIKELKKDRSFLIGAEIGCDLRLDGDLIQPRHCTIRWVDHRFRLEADPNAKNVFVGVNPITQLRLKPEAEFSIGDVEFRLRYDPTEVGTVLMPADEPVAPQDLAARIPLYRSGTFLAIASALVVLIVAGIGLYLLVQARDAKQRFESARRDLSERLYSKAIPALETFLEDYPSHDQAPEARYMLAKARVEQFTDSSTASWSNAFESSKGLIAGLANDDAFADHRTEIGDILLSISQGLANEAVERSDADSLLLSEKMLDESVQSLGQSLLETEPVARIRSLQEEAHHKVAQRTVVEDSLANMEKSLGANKPADVYREYVALIHRYSDEKANVRVKKLLDQAALQEKALVGFESKGALMAANPVEPSPARTRYVHSTEGPSSDGPVIPVMVADTLYGIHGGSGKVLWRTPMGYATAFSPVMSGSGASWILVYRPQFNDLALIDPANGQMTARATLEGIRPRSHCPAVLSGDQVFLTATDENEGTSGIVLAIRIAAGQITEVGRYLFPQPIVTPAAVDASGNNLFVIGEQASLYRINTRSHSCEKVVSLGHEAGAIRLPPLVVERMLLFVESLGLEQSRLRCLVVNPENSSMTEKPSLNLRGTVEDPPVFRNQRVYVTTTAGQSIVAELGLDTDASPLVQAAELVDAVSGQDRPPIPIVRGDSEVWLIGSSARRCVVNVEHATWTVDKEISLGGQAGPASVLAGDRILMVVKDPGRAGLQVVVLDPASASIVARSRLGELPEDVLPTNDAMTQLWPEGIEKVPTASLTSDAIVAASPLPAQVPSLYRSPTHILRIDVEGVLAWSDSGLHFFPKDTNAVMNTNLVEGGVGAAPAAFQDGFLVASKTGFVHEFDSKGAPRAKVDPFAASLSDGKLRAFAALAVLDAKDATSPVFAASDGMVFRIQRGEEPNPVWKEIARTEVDVHEARRLVVASGKLWCFGPTGVVLLDPESLKVEATIEFSMLEDMAPIHADASILVLSQKRELVRLGLGPDGKPGVLWVVALEGTPAGPPAYRDGQVWIVGVDGTVWSYALDAGQPGEKRNFDRAVARGPWIVGDDLIVVTADGSLARVPTRP